MKNSIGKKIVIIFIHALIGWALCAAVMGIGMSVMALEKTLILHAILAPVFFTLLSLLYFKRFNYTTPLLTSVIFLGFVVVVDFFIVALAIQKSLEMFTSWLGTWLPFTLIFISTYFTGLVVTKHGKKPAYT
ncbi:MAG: hypothetical protein JSV25_15425 [Spirochaetota bacterium]|nr:MAG: hypothetical protein JSV25_15425 [Spirochaetota bacterium]